jgi:hypothetical protein
MKTKHLLFSMLIILTSVFGVNKGFSQIVISGYLANPGGTDSSFEYVQLVATQDINFSNDPVTVVWANNGAATVKGWVNGAALTYGFLLDTGSVARGDVFYVGGAMKKITGSGSTDISSAKWIRTKYTGSQNGDGFGAYSSGGNMGNGGPNADGIAVFNEPVSNIDSSTIPIDVVFFGTGVGTAKPANGGYMVANNDRYNTSQGTFGNGTNTYVYPDVATTGNYFKLSGTYDLSTNSWASVRTASAVALTTSSPLSALASAITLYTPTPVVMISSLTTVTANAVQGSNHNPAYHLSCDVQTLPAALDSIKFRTFGNFVKNDIKSYGFKLWYSANSIFSTTDSLIDSVDAMGPGDLWFRNPAFQIPVNTIAHFFVTTDISSFATLGDSMYFDSLMLADVYFASAQKSGLNPQSRSGVLTVSSSSAPVINVGSLNIFNNQIINTTSPEQTYSVSAGNLSPATGNIIITPPTGFEISLTSGSGFVSSSISIPYTAGILNPTDVYVVFKPTNIAMYQGNITHIGGGATQNLQITGYGISPDTIAPKVDTAYAVNTNTVSVVFNEAVDTSAEHEQNYVIAGIVTSAVRNVSLKVVTLTLSIPLTKGVPQNITIEEVTDTCSNHNKMKPQTFQLFIPAELVINELLTKSATLGDFVEIYNPNLTKAIALNGWHLSNDSTQLLKWAFPDTSISAGSYLVVWDNQYPATPGIHCTFGLNNVSGVVLLRNASNTTIAYTKYAAQKQDTSWGRFPNGTGPYVYNKPTPGATNKLYPKAIPTYTIAQVTTNSPIGESDSVNVYCKLIGVVYGVNFSDKGLQFTIIDNSGGINIFKSGSNVTPPYTVKEGDKVKVIGKIQMYYGLIELAVDSIVRLDSNQTLKTPLLVTKLDESTESELIRLENLTLLAADTSLWPKVAGNALNVRAINLTNDTFTIRIHKKCDLQGTTPPKGKFNINGLGNQYDNTLPSYFQFYQIWPRYKADLEIVNNISPETNNLGLELYPNPNNGQFVMLNPSNSKLNISVLNSLGQEISSSVSSQSRITLSITNGNGLYFVKAVAPNGQSSILKVLVK